MAPTSNSASVSAQPQAQTLAQPLAQPLAPNPTQPFAILIQSASLGVLVFAVLALMLGPGTIWLSLSGAGFTALWAAWALRRRRPPLRAWLSALGLWIAGVHLALWLPFLFAAYVTGQGLSGLLYAAFAALVTAAAVAWYIANAYLWLTILLALALGGLLIMTRRRTE